MLISLTKNHLFYDLYPLKRVTLSLETIQRRLAMSWIHGLVQYLAALL
jgi:hypothetical protein